MPLCCTTVISVTAWIIWGVDQTVNNKCSSSIQLLLSYGKRKVFKIIECKIVHLMKMQWLPSHPLFINDCGNVHICICKHFFGKSLSFSSSIITCPSQIGDWSLNVTFIRSATAPDFLCWLELFLLLPFLLLGSSTMLLFLFVYFCFTAFTFCLYWSRFQTKLTGNSQHILHHSVIIYLSGDFSLFFCPFSFNYSSLFQ